MTEVILDASAVLCFLRKEPGADVVKPHLYGGLISTVNLAEVMFKLAKPEKPLEDIVRRLRQLELRVIEFTEEQAVIATSLKPVTVQGNLSFADRACLALGLLKQSPVLTADRIWGELNLGIELRFVR